MALCLFVDDIWAALPQSIAQNAQQAMLQQNMGQPQGIGMPQSAGQPQVMSQLQGMLPTMGQSPSIGFPQPQGMVQSQTPVMGQPKPIGQLPGIGQIPGMRPQILNQIMPQALGQTPVAIPGFPQGFIPSAFNPQLMQPQQQILGQGLPSASVAPTTVTVPPVTTASDSAPATGGIVESTAASEATLQKPPSTQVGD